VVPQSRQDQASPFAALEKKAIKLVGFADAPSAPAGRSV
jgi:hypothetical protein